jgi:hypothetical protein
VPSTLDSPRAETDDQTRSERNVFVDTPAGVERVEDRKKTFWERLEAWVSRLSTRNNFWHKVCSWIWLPIAYRSGIKKVRQETDGEGPPPFVALLPFRRFNRNWYSAMAGAALLANSEIAGGMYVFDVVGGDYTVVCKELHYKFRLPCFGPAVYKVKTDEDLHELVEKGGEFNITVEIDIYQALKQAGEGQRERRVGTSTATFHVTPKAMARERAQKARERERRKRERQMQRRAEQEKAEKAATSGERG